MQEGSVAELGQFIVNNSAFIAQTKDQNGRSLLLTAVQCGRLDVVAYLLEHGDSFPISDEDIRGLTAFHIAAQACNHDMLQLLLDSAKQRRIQINLNSLCSAGYTTLHYVARLFGPTNETDKILFAMLDANADLNIKSNPDMETPMMSAIYANNGLVKKFPLCFVFYSLCSILPQAAREIWCRRECAESAA